MHGLSLCGLGLGGGRLREEAVSLGRLAARDAVGRREALLQVGPPAGDCQMFGVAELLLMELQLELLILQVAGIVQRVSLEDGCHVRRMLLGGGLLLLLLGVSLGTVGGDGGVG